MSKPRQKKSRFYYYFWGLATVAVVSGQIYIGAGYRAMAESLTNLTEAVK